MTRKEVLTHFEKFRGTILDPAVADILISMAGKVEEGDSLFGLADNS
ncbi:hypothetical protein [Aminivibrio sp.]|jgi:hypothetical protein|nr:hypothetical protein [Aminivibrio sp.]MBL3538992.1 hypothetical protein [Aminivibrio sp.]MDK2958906.1 hypothetical protein [Synergistaceae bacterium]